MASKLWKLVHSVGSVSFVNGSTSRYRTASQTMSKEAQWAEIRKVCPKASFIESHVETRRMAVGPAIEYTVVAFCA